MRGHPAASARARCRQAIRDTTLLAGALLSGTAVLLNLLIEESIQQRLVSALIFATVPAAAALAVGATMVTLLGLLAVTYDIIRTPVVPRRSLLRLLWHACDVARRLKEYVGPAFGRTADRLIRFARGLAIHLFQTLRGAGTRGRCGLAWMSREIALEALWIKQSVRRVFGATVWIACWPIRTSALLLSRLIERNVSHGRAFGRTR
jgi:hypothetical protein